MTSFARIQLVACLALCAASSSAIKVKFGTRDGPIMPPTEQPEVAPQPPFRVPAPVWEDLSRDSPDPNSNWRPPTFVSTPRFTQEVYSVPSVQSPPPQTNAQRFVNAYLPRRPTTQLPEPSLSTNGQQQSQPGNFFTPTYPNAVPQLSAQSLPGIGIRYFVPAYPEFRQQQEQSARQEDAKHNQVDNNNVNVAGNDISSDVQWKYEKEATRRATRASREAAPAMYVYQWPVYQPRRLQ